MERVDWIRFRRVIKSMESTEKEITTNTKSGLQGQGKSAYLETSTTGTENSINAKE